MEENKNEELTFHEETVQNNEEAKGPMSKKTLIAICLFVVYVILNIYDFISLLSESRDIIELLTTAQEETPNTITIVLSIVEIVSLIGSIVMGAIALKETNRKKLSGKGLALLSIIGPIVVMIVFGVLSVVFGPTKDAFSLGFNCAQATECVDNKDNTSTCDLNGKDIVCPTTLLVESQFAVEEEVQETPNEETTSTEQTETTEGTQEAQE